MNRFSRLCRALLAWVVMAAAIIACGGDTADEAAIGLYLETKGSELAAPAGSSSEPVAFTVEPGESVAAVADRLHGEALISDPELFRRYVQFHDMDGGIEAGDFTLRQSMTIPEVAEALQHAQRPEQVVTVREGIRLEEVAETVAAQTTISQQDFLAVASAGWRGLGLAADFPFLAELPDGASLEGFLFPETYRLPQEAAAIDLIRRMLRTFDERVTLDMRLRAEERGLTIFDLVTLGAVVEREAVLPSERPLIAGVYLNRLDSGWALAADPTIQYSLGTPGNWWPQLLLDDLERDLPYNTYKIVGLPPGPICSPGLGSISAVAYPEATDYYFFLADCTAGDGSHLFSRSFEEHVEKYAACGG